MKIEKEVMSKYQKLEVLINAKELEINSTFFGRIIEYFHTRVIEIFNWKCLSCHSVEDSIAERKSGNGIIGNLLKR